MKTNYDVIRLNLKPRQLAAMIICPTEIDNNFKHPGREHCEKVSCVDCCCEWLKRPASETAWKNK